jgi:hypothetical protein
VARNHIDQGARALEARPGESQAKAFSGGPAAATEMQLTPTPNFTVLSTEPDAPAELLGILRYGKVRSTGKDTWLVAARHEDWIHGREHVVLQSGAVLVCDCRQGWAGRACAHVVVVRHLATVEPTVAPDPRQMRLTSEPGPPVVRTRTPERRFCIRCKVKPRLYTMRPVPAWERG